MDGPSERSGGCFTAGVGLIILVVYVDAIAVLYLFVAMMLNIKLAEIDDSQF